MLAYDKPCKYCKKTVHIRNSHVRTLDNKLSHISCHEDYNSHKSYCISCGGEIIIVVTWTITANYKIKKDGTLAKKSHKVDRKGEGTHVFLAHCDKCGEKYDFNESNGIFTILGKSSDY